MVLKMSSFEFISPLPRSLYFMVALTVMLLLRSNYFHFENFLIGKKESVHLHLSHNSLVKKVSVFFLFHHLWWRSISFRMIDEASLVLQELYLLWVIGLLPRQHEKRKFLMLRYLLYKARESARSGVSYRTWWQKDSHRALVCVRAF